MRYARRVLVSLPRPPLDAAATTAHNLALRAELLRVVDALQAAGLAPVVLKGFPLLERLGGSLGERRLVDNDLLVGPRDVPSASAVLRRLGYVSLPGRTLESDLRRNYEHPWILPDGRGGHLCCELHWAPAAPWAFDFSEALLAEHTRALPLFGRRVHVLDEPLTLLQLAAHMVQHELCEPRTLRVLARAWERWSARLDREELARLAARVGVRAALAYGLTVTARELRSPAPPWAPGRAARLALAGLPPEAALREQRLGPRERYRRAALSLTLVAPRHYASATRRRVLPPSEQGLPGSWGSALARHGARLRRLEAALRQSSTPQRLPLVVEYLLARRRLIAAYPLCSLPLLLERASAPPRALASPLEALLPAVAAAERIAARLYPAHDTCLYRALTRYALLCRHAVGVRFHLSAPTDQASAGHAWVSVQGRMVLEPASPPPELWSYPPDSGPATTTEPLGQGLAG